MISHSPPVLTIRLWAISLALAMGGWLGAGLSRAEAQSLYTPEIYRVQGADRETGFRLGRGRLHSVLGIRNRYDSNVLYADGAAKQDYVLEIIPGADYFWNSARLDLKTGYRFTVRNSVTVPVQDSRQHRAFLDGTYRLSRTFRLIAGERFEKSADPADVELLERVGRLTNEAKAGLKYVTLGEDLDVVLLYTNLYQRYDSLLKGLSFYNNKVNLTSRFNVSSQFRFLPKSVASISVEYGQTDFTNDPSVTVPNADSKGVFLSAGLTSQISRKISVAARLGLSLIYFDTPPDNRSMTGGLDIQYAASPSLRFTVGYERLAQISTFTNYHEDHRFRLLGNWKFARRFETYNDLRVFLLEYSGPNVTLNGVHRDDSVIENVFGTTYAFLEWAKLRLEYQVDWRTSNAAHPFTGEHSADFLKHQVSLGIDLYY